MSTESTARLNAAAKQVRAEGGARNVALADWLDGLASRISRRDRPTSPEHEANIREALAVADAILADRCGDS